MSVDQFKAINYGMPGSGKTGLVATLLDLPEEVKPSYLPVLLLDFEQGQRSIRSRCNTIECIERPEVQHGVTRLHRTYNIEQLKNPKMDAINRVWVDTWDDFREVWDLLNKHVKPHTYKTYVMDTVSQADRVCQDAVAKNSGASPFEVQPITLPQMNQLSTHLVWLVKYFINTGDHVILNAHITEKDDPGFAKETEMPLVTTGRLRQELCAMVDVVIRTWSNDSKIFNATMTKNMGQYCKFRAEDPSKVAGVTFSSSPTNNFNYTAILRALGDIK